MCPSVIFLKPDNEVVCGLVLQGDCRKEYKKIGAEYIVVCNRETVSLERNLIYGQMLKNKKQRKP